MSNENQETIADIVREMRKRAEEVYAGQAGYPESWKDQMNDDEIREIADRIEAALKREKANPVRNCGKYKTAKDAFAGFNKMCDGKTCYRCPFSAERNECMSCVLNWLYAKEDKDVSK